MSESEKEDSELAFIRKTVTLERIELAEKIVRELAMPQRARNLSGLESYFGTALMESVYRAHKGSIKIVSSKDRGEIFLATILYVLFGEPEFEFDSADPAILEGKIRTVLKKRFRRDSYFSEIALRYLATKTGDRVMKTSWIDIGPYFYTILGGEIFYYCTLQSLIEVSRKTLTDKSFRFTRLITWQQGIVIYLIAETWNRIISFGSCRSKGR